MPLPVSMDATWLGNTANPIQFNAQELRRADSAGFAGDGTAFGVRGGIVRHGDASLSVSVNASDVVTIQPGAVVVPGNSGVGNGCYCSALGAAETGNLVARNATNPRVDLVVYRVYDDDVVTTHNLYTGRIEIITGIAAASPAVPALPSLATELARITVPATGAGAATVDLSHRTFASSIGGRLWVTTAARLPSGLPLWTRATALDTGRDYVWNGISWTSGEWATYTPAVYGGMVVGSGAFGGRFKLLDAKTLELQIYYTVAGAASLPGQIVFGLPPGLLANVAPAGRTQSILCRYYTGVGSAQDLAFASTSTGYGADRIGLVAQGGTGLGAAQLAIGANLDVNGIIELA